MVHDRTAVAVLPFVVREGSPEASYLADGMTDGLIADLAQIASLKIIPRSSSALAEKASTSLSEIAKELGVAAVVKGSILRTGDTVRASVRLFHAAADAMLWTKDYQAPIDGLPRLQRDITLAIAGEIHAELEQDERKRLGTPLDPLSVPLRETLQTDSTDVLAKWGLALVAEQQGRPDEAIAILKPIIGRSLNRTSSLGHAYGMAGRVANARAVLDTLHARATKGYVPSYFFALVHAGLDEPDEALEWLERAYVERSTVLAYLRIDPRIRSLHDNPRFGALVQRISGGD